MLPIILCAVGATLGQADAEGAPLYTFDLTYTTQLNREDPREMRRIWDETHLVTSLQGLVNRDAPRLYLFAVGGDDAGTDRFWLDHLRSEGEWLHGRALEPVPTISALIALFRDDIRGLVVYDERVPSTSNVASTVAGVEDLLCVRYDPAPDSLYTQLTETEGLEPLVWLLNRDGSPMFTGEGVLPGTETPSSGSAKCDAYLWAIEHYLKTGRCNPAKMGYYHDAFWFQKSSGYVFNHTLTNHDYFISHRGFFFDLAPFDDEAPNDDPSQPIGTDARTMQAILRAAWEQLEGKEMIHVGGFVPWDTKYTSVAGGGHEPVPVEWRYAEILSSYNAYMDADALGMSAMANASLYRHYPLQERYPQVRPTIADLKARGLIDADGRVAPKHYITIYVGDYDSAAWLYQMLPGIWNDPDRGSIPLGWAFNPTLAQRFAPGMVYTRNTASELDYFMAGDSGAGYINPGHLQEPRAFSGLPSGVDTWRRHCEKWFRQWDLGVTGFIIDGYAPPMEPETLNAYAAFSPEGIAAQKIEPLGLHKDMPYVRMDYDLTRSPQESAETVLHRLGDKAPEFKIFRTILWKPSGHKALFEALKASERGEDIEIVDPYSLFLLAKQHLTHTQGGQE